MTTAIASAHPSGLPKLRRYVVNVVTPGSEEHEYDGFAELWFDSEDDAQVIFEETK